MICSESLRAAAYRLRFPTQRGMGPGPTTRSVWISISRTRDKRHDRSMAARRT